MSNTAQRETATEKPTVVSIFSKCPTSVYGMLTPDAIVVYSYYLNKPNGWTLRPGQLVSALKISRDKVYKALKELKTNFLVIPEEIRSTGNQFTGIKYHRFATMDQGKTWKKEHEKQNKKAGKQKKPKTATAPENTPLTGFPDTEIQYISKKEVNKKENIPTPPPCGGSADALSTEEVQESAEAILTERYGEIPQEDKLWLHSKIDRLKDKLPNATIQSLLTMVQMDFAERLQSLRRSAKFAAARDNLADAQIVKIQKRAEQIIRESDNTGQPVNRGSSDWANGSYCEFEDEYTEAA